MRSNAIFLFNAFISISILIYLCYCQQNHSKLNFNFDHKNLKNLQSYLTSKLSKDYAGKDAYRYCNPVIIPKTFSSPNDLCITSVYHMERNLALNLFSVRKSGCAASIAILTDENTWLSPQTQKIMKLFHVTVVQGKYHGTTIRRHTDFQRDKLLYYYLKQISKKKSYDRVFFFDSFDVYFQSDPFEYFNHSDTVYLFQEAYEILQNTPFNWDGVRFCFGEDAAAQIADKHIFCSGTIASGSVISMISFFERIIQMDAFNNEKCPYDQGFIIYMANTEKYQHGDHYSLHLFPPEYPVAACKIGPFHVQSKDTYSIATSYLNDKIIEYSVVHQYTSNGQLTDSYNQNTNYQKYIDDYYEKEEKFEIPIIKIDVKN